MESHLLDPSTSEALLACGRHFAAGTHPLLPTAATLIEFWDKGRLYRSEALLEGTERCLHVMLTEVGCYPVLVSHPGHQAGWTGVGSASLEKTRRAQEQPPEAVTKQPTVLLQWSE